MKHNLDPLLARYPLHTTADYERALREIVQELALVGLWRSKFFEHAAFYGGTALRIFHGLRRFSEDLDFSLLVPRQEFRLDSHLGAVRDELQSFGFHFSVESKSKTAVTAIESAFIKGGTRINLLHIGLPDWLARNIPQVLQVRVKLELDTQPPAGAETEVRTQLMPIPHQVRLYDLPSLMAGKLHAVLCRKWQNRVKGRDWYDLVWYAGRAVRPNLVHLAARMAQTGHWPAGESMDAAALIRLLMERIGEVDFDAAASDVRPFITDSTELSLWSPDFFRELAARLFH
jgi:predicted nucleotidyltransferase component of viral defense system